MITSRTLLAILAAALLGACAPIDVNPAGGRPELPPELRQLRGMEFLPAG
jgi:hypothetical protein